MFKFAKKLRDNPQSGILQTNKASGGKQSVKGGINISIEEQGAKSDNFDVERLVKAFDKIEGRFDELDKRFDSFETRLHSIENKTDKTNLALKIYVQGNGVKQEIKDAVKMVLDEA